MHICTLKFRMGVADFFCMCECRATVTVHAQGSVRVPGGGPCCIGEVEGGVVFLLRCVVLL